MTPAFGVLVRRVRVRNFKSLADVTVALERRTTILVGENNSGKTSFLEAIATALGRRRARPEDLRRSAEGVSKHATVDLDLAPLGNEFPDTATAVFGDAIQGVTTDAPYVVIRARIDLDETRADVRLTRQYLKGWEGPHLPSPHPSDKALALVSFEFLDARRDILEQLRNQSSLLGRALRSGPVAPELRTKAEEGLRGIADLLRSGLPSLVTLRTHLKSLRATLPAGVKSIDVDPLPQQLDDIIRSVDLRVDDEAGSFPASALGMGTRALAALLVFRTFVDVGRTTIADPQSSASLAGFEEPEAHLHPQAQRFVVRTIKEMPGQVVMSTHSGEVAAQVDVPEIRLFRREAGAAVVKHFAGGPAPESEDGLKRRRMLLGRQAGALFARAVIVVEGETESALLPILADSWWSEFGGAHARGVEFVTAMGAGSAKHVIPTLDAWAVPWWLVVDGDNAGREAVAGVSTALNRTLDDSAEEVVVVAPKLEEHLLRLPDLRNVVFEVGRAWPDQSIDEWRDNLHGQKGKGGSTRDYRSPGWEDRLALDWLQHLKGTVGARLGRAIVAAMATGLKLPPVFQGLFEKIDTRLGGAP